MSGRKEGHINDLLRQLCAQQLSDCSPDSAEVARAYQRHCRTIDTKPTPNQDEHKVSEDVRKLLVSKKGYNASTTFTDAYDRLVQLDGPKNRTGVLHFLHLLSSSKSRSDIIAVPSSVPNSIRGTRGADVSAGSASPALIGNREVAVKRTTGGLVTPRYASAVLSAESFDGYSEADLIRDLLFVFQGIETNAIRWDASRMCYVPSPLIQLPRTRLDLASKLAELGFLFRQVKLFIEQRLNEQSYGLIGQAFCSALTGELKEYYRLIAVMENQNAAGKLSLHRLLVWSYDTFDRLRLLCSLCNQVGYQNGGALASSLHAFLQSGDPAFHGLAKKVLHLTTRPLREMLRRWIYEGDCSDVYGEFFVTMDSNVAEDSLWESKYSIKLDMLPCFISKEMAERILLIGKTINFIRVVCRDHEAINFPFSTVATNSEGLNDIIGPDLNSHISEVYKITSAHLIRLLKKEFLLCEHLSAIRDYLLLGQGDFVQHLMDLICKDLSAMSFDIQSSMLQSKLETAQRATNAQYHHPAVTGRVTVLKLEESAGDTGWDTFTLDYDLAGGPLTVIVNYDSRETYLCIFRMLWKTKRIEHGLKRVWENTVTWSRVLPHLSRDIAPFRHLVNMVNNEMQHFVSQVQYYINFEVLECSWKELEGAVDTAENLDNIIDAHKKFVSVVSERLMLNEEHRAVMVKLYSVFAHAINFIAVYDEASDMLKAHEVVRRERETAIKSNTDKGGWGTNAAKEEAGRAEDMEFRERLAHISQNFETIREGFATCLGDLLSALSREQDDTVKFLSLRIDFNEFYRGHVAVK